MLGCARVDCLDARSLPAIDSRDSRPLLPVPSGLTDVLSLALDIRSASVRPSSGSFPCILGVVSSLGIDARDRRESLRFSSPNLLPLRSL